MTRHVTYAIILIQEWFQFCILILKLCLKSY